MRSLGDVPGSVASGVSARTRSRTLPGPEGGPFNSPRNKRRRGFPSSPASLERAAGGSCVVRFHGSFRSCEPAPGPPVLPFSPLQVTGLGRRRCRAHRPSPATRRSRARRRRSPCRARAATASATAPASSSDAQAAAARQRPRGSRTCAGGLAPPAARRTNCSRRRNGSAVARVAAEGSKLEFCFLGSVAKSFIY